MGDLPNAHPVDRLADIRTRIRILEEEEQALRAHLLDHAEDRVGDLYIAQVGTWPRRKVDLEGLTAAVGPAVIQKFTTNLAVATIRLKPRATDES